MWLALHMRASNDIKWPFRKQLQPNLYQECVGECSHCSQAPYHPSYGFEACFMVFLIETNTELCAVCLIAKKDMLFAFSC